MACIRASTACSAPIRPARQHLLQLSRPAYTTGSPDYLQLHQQPWQGSLLSHMQHQQHRAASHKASAQHKGAAATGELDKKRVSAAGEHKASAASSPASNNSDVQLLEKLMGSTWALDTLNVTVPFIGNGNVLSKMVGRSAGKLAGTGLRKAGIFVQIALGAGIILTAARHNVPAFQLVRMAVNLLGGSVVGAVPLLGSFTRTAYHANQKNLKLLETHVDPAKMATQDGKHKSGGGGFLQRHKLLAVMAIPAAAAAATAFGGWYFVLHKIGLV